MLFGFQNLLPNYFSLTDILVTQEIVPCTVDITIYRLGFLDPSKANDDLQPGTKLELPYWLAQALHSRRRHIVSIDMPKPYKEGYREILNADASVVDLHKLGPHYYDFGLYLIRFNHMDALKISKTLIQTFKERFRRIMDSSQNSEHSEAGVLIAKLDELERKLFQAGQLCSIQYIKWQTRETEKLSTSTMVLNHKKRKRAAMEL